MGKKLDKFLGRGFKIKKFKTTLNLAISRLAVIKNQHQARYSIARSDVKELLNLGQQERALLLRVEHVIKEQNMLDVFDLIETYCHLLKERADLLEQAHECPEELKEAICSMIYAASRCGGFPELQQLRSVYKTRFGNEFVARAVELRNNCGVNSKMIQKLSTRTPTYENRMKMLKEIALENNIVLHIEEEDSVATEFPRLKMEAENQEDPSNISGESRTGVNTPIATEVMERDEVFSYSMKTGRKYKDVADAAQAAFESAAYAATAARAAVELSRMDSHDSDDPRSPSLQPRKVAVSPDLTGSKLQTTGTKNSSVESENVDPLQNYYYKSEDDEMYSESEQEEFKQSEKDAGGETSLAIIIMDSADNCEKETIASSDEGRVGENAAFDESDDETEYKSTSLLSGPIVLDSSKSDSLHTHEGLSSESDGNVNGDAAEESKVKIV